jgi:hypothetical protein
MSCSFHVNLSFSGPMVLDKKIFKWLHPIFCIFVIISLWKDWLIDYLLFYVPLKNISLVYGDVTITGEGLQNLGLCSALRAFEQDGIFIMPHLLWHRVSVFLVSSEGLPHSIASYGTHGDAENLFLPGSSWGPFEKNLALYLNNFEILSPKISKISGYFYSFAIFAAEQGCNNFEILSPQDFKNFRIFLLFCYFCCWTGV